MRGRNVIIFPEGSRTHVLARSLSVAVCQRGGLVEIDFLNVVAEDVEDVLVVVVGFQIERYAAPFSVKRFGLQQLLVVFPDDGALRRSDLGVDIEHIAEACGFRNRSYFHTVFRQLTGMTPAQYLEL